MTSVDEIFRKSGLPGKRKLDAVRDPTEIYKTAKLSPNGHSARHARVADEADSDTEAGPPPHDEGDSSAYGPSAPAPEDDDPDDEDGRFFGGGITTAEAEVLDFVPDAADAPPEKIDAPWLRKTALAFEKRITRNAALRARHEAEPARFIDSEAELDAAVKALSILGEHPELYPEFVRVGSAGSLVGLLAHENTDIAISTLEILGELTDEDVRAGEGEWDVLVGALVEADLLGLLVSNLGRLDEKDEADQQGVYYALGIVENLCSSKDTAEVVGRDEGLLKWLLARIQHKEGAVSQNKQFAAEILAIMAQASPTNRRKLAEMDATDVMLQLVAAYRKRDPEGGEEEEYMANLFEALTCLVDEAEGKAKFVEAEGIELCLIMLKEGKMSKVRALRLLDHAVGGGSGTEVCEKLVLAGGLKTLFTMFIKKDVGLFAEHLLGIFSWMLRLLGFESAERVRLLSKFVEKDYEKLEKLLKLRREYASKIGTVDRQIEREGEGLSGEDKEELASDWLSRRLDAGLFCLQTIDVILAWLIAEDDGAKAKIKNLLADRDESFDAIQETIREQLDGIDSDEADGKDTRDMLATLLDCL